MLCFVDVMVLLTDSCGVFTCITDTGPIAGYNKRKTKCEALVYSIGWPVTQLLVQPFPQVHIKKSKLRVTCLYERNPPVIKGFPSQRASNVENVSIWWRHHVTIFAGKTWRFRFDIDKRLIIRSTSNWCPSDVGHFIQPRFKLCPSDWAWHVFLTH